MKQIKLSDRPKRKINSHTIMLLITIVLFFALYGSGCVMYANKDFGKLQNFLNVLINNAGISNNDALVHHTMDNWKAVVDVNQTAVYNMSRYAMSALKKTEGCIINTSSVTGVHSSPSGIAYPATKAAVISMTKYFAYALAPVGIRCNCIAPGVTHTEIIDNLPQFAIDSIGDTIPLKMSNRPAMARTEDIAYSMMFLASPYAEYITGACLQVDGGYRPSNMHQFVDWGEDARH